MNTPEELPPQAGLNPQLRRRTDATHDTTASSPAPVETTSVQRDEGRVWPIIWAMVTLICVAVAVWFLFL